MKTDIFTFDLPESHIANAPANPRDSSKLLHIQVSDTNVQLNNLTVADLDKILRPNDVLVFNDTKVIPARLYGKRGEANIEITLFKQLNLSDWETLIKNSRRLKQGDIIVLSDDLRPLITFNTSPVSSGSSAEVGSSKHNISGLIARALAIATLCC